MPLSESDTRAKLIDSAIHGCGWTEDLIRREETAGAIEVIDDKPRKRSSGLPEEPREPTSPSITAPPSTPA